MPLSQSTWIYLSSGGYLAQCKTGSEEHFGNERMEQLLISLKDLPADEQKKKLEEALENWKETREQNDDILFMGFRI
jgi:serine phosphatase RsbU (regulator of sigma subunit)